MTSMITALGGAVFILFIYLSIITVSIWATAKVISKAGYSGWWVLVSFVPLLNMVMFLVFAFNKWPIESRLEAATRGLYGPGPGGPYGDRSPGGYPPYSPAPPTPSAGPPPAPPAPPYGSAPMSTPGAALTQEIPPWEQSAQPPQQVQPAQSAEPDIPPFRI